MSDSENSRPGLIRAGYPSSGTDRGDLTNVELEIDESPHEASYSGVLVYRTVSEPQESDGRLRRLLAMSIVGIIAVVVIVGLVAHVWVSIQTKDTTSMDSFIDVLTKTLIPLVTLFVGYLCGKTTAHSSRQDRKVDRRTTKT